MIATRVYHGGEEFVALFAEANTDAKPYIEVEEACDTDVDTNRHAREFRRPNCDKAVIGTVEFSAIVEDADWQAWRGIQAFVGDRRVVVPIWSDVVLAADWAARVHKSDLVLGFNEGYASAKLGTEDDLPPRTYLAPVCVGRLKLNEDQPWTNNAAEAKVEVTFDAAFRQAIVGELFTFNGTADATAKKINYSVQGDNAIDATASYKIDETTKGVAIPNQTEPVTATASFSVAETAKGTAVTNQTESLGVGAAFIVEETLQS